MLRVLTCGLCGVEEELQPEALLLEAEEGRAQHVIPTAIRDLEHVAPAPPENFTTYHIENAAAGRQALREILQKLPSGHMQATLMSLLLLDLQPLPPSALEPLCRCLSQAEQRYLYPVLADLPPAVMGDMEAQQSSRVLLEAAADAHDSIEFDRQRRPNQVSRALPAAKSILAQVAAAESTQLIISLPSFDALPSTDRTRLVLQHLLAARALPASINDRKAVLDSILPLRGDTAA